MSLYGAVGPVDVREIEVAPPPRVGPTWFLCLDERSSMELHMSPMYCWSLFGGRYIAAILIGLLLLRCILVAVISSCVGVVIGSWMMSDLMASSTPPPYPSFLSFRRSECPGGNISLSVMVWLSHVSVPMRISGSCVEMKLPSSAVLFLILWKCILMILRGL